MSTTVKTTAQRVDTMRARRGIKRIPLDGDVIERLAAYRDENGFKSYSEALREILERVEKPQ